jgi:hypothetical protein
LIAFDGEQIVGFGVADGLGDLRIAGDGVDGDHGAFEAPAGGKFPEQHGDGGRFVGLVVDRLLSENQMAARGEGLRPNAAPRFQYSACPRCGKNDPAKAATPSVVRVRKARRPSAGSKSGAL